MTQPEKKSQSPVIAAAIILAAAGVAFYFLPVIMIALGDVSPWLAATAGTCFVLAFFLIFWLRARYQRGKGG